MRTNRLISREQAATLPLAARIKFEMELTDAELKRIKSAKVSSNWRFQDYRDYSPWRRYLFEFLGSLKDKVILDLGCGYHPTPVYFALAGAGMVYACDVSPKAVEYALKQAQSAGVADRVTGFVCAGEQLPLPDDAIDIIHGAGVLHHLYLPLAKTELNRVLKAGGKAAFKDPLGQNILLELVRDYVPYRWKKDAKGTDRPLRFKDIQHFGEEFSYCSYHGFGLTSLLTTLIWGRGDSKARRVADGVDDFVLQRMPFLQRYCRFVVTCVQK